MENVMQEFHARRLLKLARKLDAVPREKFEISIFYEKYKKASKGRTTCNTVACALGWACTIPSFKKAGLSLSLVGDDGNVSGDPVFTPTDKAEKRLCIDRRDCEDYGWYDYQYGLSAGRYFFGLTNEETSDLFTPGGYQAELGLVGSVTPKRVARRIRQIVSKYFPELVRRERAKKPSVSRGNRA